MISCGSGSFISLINDLIVLNYLCVPGNRESIKIKAELLANLGSHPRILALRGLKLNRVSLL